MVMHEDLVNDQYIMDIGDFLQYLKMNKLILVKVDAEEDENLEKNISVIHQLILNLVLKDK
jgi:hypothetical protein